MRGLYHLACERIADTRSRAVGLLEEAEVDVLVYLDFPYARYRFLRINNVLEWANHERKQQIRVVRVFPSGRLLIRMLGAVLSEMDGDWTSMRWFTEESIAWVMDLMKANASASVYEGTAEEHVRRIIDVVVADNPIGRRTA